MPQGRNKQIALVDRMAEPLPIKRRPMRARMPVCHKCGKYQTWADARREPLTFPTRNKMEYVFWTDRRNIIRAVTSQSRPEKFPLCWECRFEERETLLGLGFKVGEI